MSRGFLTIAYGPAEYLRMAKGLARSIKFHSPKSELALVTDRNDPELGVLFDLLIPLDERFGSGVSQKLHVDKYSPYDQTLFVDSDCLAFANPESLWEEYRESNGFGVKGWTYLGSDDSHYAIENTRTLFESCGVERLGAFNSGLFYFDRSLAAKKLFETARELASRPLELGLRSFKNSPCADEPVFAAALEMNGISTLPWDDGRSMCTATADDMQGLESINVFTGHRRLVRYNTVTEPIFLHFHMQTQQCFPYLRELSRLQLGVRFGRGVLPSIYAIPCYGRTRLRYLTSRALQRVHNRGFIGLVPERLELAWRRRLRGAA